MKPLLIAAQISVALSILNVWLLRRRVASPWRGGEARSLREEFAAYGLPAWAMTAVGAGKVGCALVLLAGLFYPSLILPAAASLALFMVAAIVMHVKVADPLEKSMPAAAVLMLTLVTAALSAN